MTREFIYESNVFNCGLKVIYKPKIDDIDQSVCDFQVLDIVKATGECMIAVYQGKNDFTEEIDTKVNDDIEANVEDIVNRQVNI